MAERAVSGRKNADIHYEDEILKKFDSSETTQEETLPVQLHYPHHDDSSSTSSPSFHSHPSSSLIYSPHLDLEHPSLIVDSFLAVTIPSYEILDGNNALSLGGGRRVGTGTGGEVETFVKYMIKVSSVHTEWIVMRRYSEFLVLQDLIKTKYPFTSSYFFPPKKFFGRFDAKFLEHRRLKLEQYLQKLIFHEEILQSVQLRNFLKIGVTRAPQFSNQEDQHLLSNSDPSSPSSTSPSSTSPTSSPKVFTLTKQNTETFVF